MPFVSHSQMPENHISSSKVNDMFDKTSNFEYLKMWLLTWEPALESILQCLGLRISVPDTDIYWSILHLKIWKQDSFIINTVIKTQNVIILQFLDFIQLYQGLWTSLKEHVSWQKDKNNTSRFINVLYHVVKCVSPLSWRRLNYE